MNDTDAGTTSLRCGRPPPATTSGVLHLEGVFPTVVDGTAQVVVGQVTVTSASAVVGVSAGAADVVLARDDVLVTMPLPQDAIGRRVDLQAGDSLTLPAVGSMVGCAPGVEALAPGTYDLHARVVVVPDDDPSPHVVIGGPWSLQVR